MMDDFKSCHDDLKLVYSQQQKIVRYVLVIFEMANELATNQNPVVYNVAFSFLAR